MKFTTYWVFDLLSSISIVIIASNDIFIAYELNINITTSSKLVTHQKLCPISLAKLPYFCLFLESDHSHTNILKYQFWYKILSFLNKLTKCSTYFFLQSISNTFREKIYDKIIAMFCASCLFHFNFVEKLTTIILQSTNSNYLCESKLHKNDSLNWKHKWKKL